MNEQVVTIPDTPERDHRKSESSDTEQDFTIISLPEVHVPTNEEEEEVFFKLRAKLYRFEGKADPPEWKERGTGELKILRHKEKNSYRIVMRRDKTLKVCANHFITPWIELEAHKTNERAFVYTCMADFADEECKSECLAIKFSTKENALLFKSKFEEAKKRLLMDCDLYNGKIEEEIRAEIEKNLQGVEEDEEDKENVTNLKGVEKDEEDKENVTNELTEKLSELNVAKKEEGESDDKVEK